MLQHSILMQQEGTPEPEPTSTPEPAWVDEEAPHAPTQAGEDTADTEEQITKGDHDVPVDPPEWA